MLGLLKYARRACRFSLRTFLVASGVAAAIICVLGIPIRDHQTNLRIKEHIGLIGGRVTEEPVASGPLVWFIPEATLRIVRVDLVNTHVKPRDLESLTQLPELKSLYLYYTDTTDAGLMYLCHCSKLQTLDLDGTRVTDAGLEDIGKIRGLKWLGLRDTKISDSGIRHLESLPSLQQVLLWNTNVTDAGADALRAARPDLAVSLVPLQE